MVVRRHAAQRAEREHIQREVFRRAKQKRDAGKDRGQQDQANRRKECADKGCGTGQDECIARFTTFGHGIAVKRGHQRRFITWNIQQNGTDPPAIHRAVINGGHQHQSRCRIKAEGKGDRDQDRNAVRRTKTWKRANNRADKAADHRQHQRVRRQRD